MCVFSFSANAIWDKKVLFYIVLRGLDSKSNDNSILNPLKMDIYPFIKKSSHFYRLLKYMQ